MKYMEKLYINDNMLFKDKLPQDLYTAFQIITLLIEKGNLYLIHNKDSFNISIIYQGKENWINYIMKCNSWTTKSDFAYLHFLYQNSSIHTSPTSQHPYMQETRKIDT